ncbi:MAG: glutamyl-tRNA reductase [Planctomycetaceae bacterium]
MNVRVAFCNHHSAGLDLRERLAFASTDDLHKAYQRLREGFPDTETVVLSTCNRVELYAAQQDSDRLLSHQDLVQFFSEFHQLPAADFADELLEQTGPDAVRHLFDVISSIDSMVLGEPQIVNQVKEAYRVAQENNASGPLTNSLFQRAIGVSGRVRTETRLAEGRVSIASVAVSDFGKGIFDHFHDKTVLVIGAGEMAEETLRYLADEGVHSILVVNRNLARAQSLADRWRGEAADFSQLDTFMARADMIISATGADRPLVDVDRFRHVREHTGDRPVFILDLGAPRDFDPAVGDLDPGVFLYDMDHLEVTCAQNRQARQSEVRRARDIIDEETQRFMQELYHRATGPVVKQLREEWHNISRQEIDRLFAKTDHLNSEDRQAIERTVERIVNKLLHPPLETLKVAAREGPPLGLMDALKRLLLRD